MFRHSPHYFSQHVRGINEGSANNRASHTHDTKSLTPHHPLTNRMGLCLPKRAIGKRHINLELGTCIWRISQAWQTSPLLQGSFLFAVASLWYMDLKAVQGR